MSVNLDAMSQYSSETMTCYNEKVEKNISAMLMNHENGTIMVIYDGYVVTLDYSSARVLDVQSLNLDLENTQNTYKFLVDYQYCKKLNLLILAFRIPPPSSGYSTRSFADPQYAVQYSTTRVCFFLLNKEKNQDLTNIRSCNLVYELYMGRHGHKNLINSFCSMSLDPEEKFLLISGYQDGNFEASVVQVLSLDKMEFCKVQASEKYKKYFEFGRDFSWLDSKTFVMGSEMNGLVVSKIDKSNVFGLKLSILNESDKFTRSNIFSPGYLRKYTLLNTSTGQKLGFLKAKSMCFTSIKI